MSTETSRPDRGVATAAVTITFWNLVSRILGFARVISTAAALGIAALGDTYQRTNQVSNLLFELLAGGMLFAVLVPTFVSHRQRETARDTGALAGAITTRAVAALGAVTAIGLILARPLMVALTAGVDDLSRPEQIDLGVFWLWFVLPQLMFYGVGAVSSALLQADNRFVAASVAPAGSSLIVTLTMVVFSLSYDPSQALALTAGQKILLGGGTLAATVVMAIIPVLAAARAGYPLRLGWKVPGREMATLARRGAWAAGHVGTNQVLAISTIVLAGSLNGGVIAYQTAFTFFLLPHALLAHPIFTSLYPRLATSGGEGPSADLDLFADTLGQGLRTMAALILPASALMAALATPTLDLARVGQLDHRGSELVASTLAAYLAGLAGYSITFLLTRASYALGDARSPTIINLGVTGSIIAAMVVARSLFSGPAMLVAFGLATAAGTTIGAVRQHHRVVGLVGQPIAVRQSLARSTVVAGVAGGAAWAVVAVTDFTGVVGNLLTLGVAGAIGAAAGSLVLAILGPDDVQPLLSLVSRVRRRLP